MHSVVKHGFQLTLFSYEQVQNVPAGVLKRDANEILPQNMRNRIIYEGKPNLSHFSDLFRYQMIAKEDLVWIDADMLMVGGPPPISLPDIIVQEEQGGFNGAILYISEKAKRDYLLKMMEEKFDSNLRWGETGPALIASVVQSARPSLRSYDHDVFYPMEHYDVWKLLLPEYRDECKNKCNGSSTIHLFNNILNTIGYWKEVAPPSGSYLHEKLTELDAVRFFSSIYPVSVLRSNIDNFRFRQNGKALGIKTLVREAIPSIARTYHHYRKSKYRSNLSPLSRK